MSAQSAPKYPAGARVVVCGLTDAKHNEKAAKVIDFKADKERYSIRIGEAAPILVKEINLRPSLFGPS